MVDACRRRASAWRSSISMRHFSSVERRISSSSHVPPRTRSIPRPSRHPDGPSARRMALSAHRRASSRTTMAFPPLPGSQTGNRGDPSPPAHRRDASDGRQPKRFVNVCISTRETSETKSRFQRRSAPSFASFYPKRWINGERKGSQGEQEVGNEEARAAPQGVRVHSRPRQVEARRQGASPRRGRVGEARRGGDVDA